MSRSLFVMWCSVIVAAVTLLIVAGVRTARAYAAASESRRELITVTHQAAELSTLRRGTRDFPARPAGGGGGLAVKVSAAMSRAGFTNSNLQSLAPEAAAAITGEAGAKLLRERATLTLTNLSLPQVGTFLAAWRTAEPDWVISGIDLSPMSAGPASSTRNHTTIGTDLPMRAVITIEGVFAAPPPKPGVSR